MNAPRPPSSRALAGWRVGRAGTSRWWRKSSWPPAETKKSLPRSDAARFIVAFYGSTPAYRPVLDVEGWGELQPELNALSKRGEWQSMGSLIDDDVFGRIAVRGTPEEAAAEIARRFPDCDRICAYFPGYSPSDELIAEFTAARQGHVVSDPVLFECADGVATLTLAPSRDKRNAFSGEMARLLGRAPDPL